MNSRTRSMLGAVAVVLAAGSVWAGQSSSPRQPQRDVSDPGVMAVGQRVTPAGMQSVFSGRVAGVRFGADPDELWAVASGSAWHLAWRENRVIGRAEFNGRPGMQGIAIDPVTGRAVVSSTGRLPSDVAASRT